MRLVTFSRAPETTSRLQRKNDGRGSSRRAPEKSETSWRQAPTRCPRRRGSDGLFETTKEEGEVEAEAAAGAGSTEEERGGLNMAGIQSAMPR